MPPSACRALSFCFVDNGHGCRRDFRLTTEHVFLQYHMSFSVKKRGLYFLCDIGSSLFY